MSSSYPKKHDSPCEWKSVELSDVCELRKEMVQPSSSETSYYIGLEHIEPGNPKLTAFGSSDSVKSTKSKFYPKDLLYGKLRPYLDKAALAEREGICSTDILVLRALEGRSIPEYLVNLLHHEDFIKHAIRTTKGVNHPRTSWASIKQYKFLLPPLSEQMAVAGVLTKIHEAITVENEIIRFTRELKQALMSYLFTYGPVPQEYAVKTSVRKTKIGSVPEHWRVVPMDEVIEKPQYGYTTSAVEFEVGPKFLRITDIQNDTVNWSKVPYCQCSSQDEKKYKLQPGDILLARIGATTGKSYFVRTPVNAIFASYLIRVKSKRNINSEYLYQITKSQIYWDQINASKGGRLKQGINIPVLRNLLVPLPNLSEQEEIAHILLIFDGKIELAENRKLLLQELFRAALQELITGKIRTKGLKELLGAELRS